MNKLKYCLLSFIVCFLFTTFAYGSDSLILYYTRTGNNRMIANYIHAKIPNSELIEIKTKDDRKGILGFITCLFDQWFDREAEINNPNVDYSKYETLILCSPIWMQNLSSPVRTFIKQADFHATEAYLFVTYGGRLKEENKNEIEKWMVEQGIIPRGVYGSAVSKKTDEEIKKQIDEYLKEAKLLNKQ